jgi:hypothetical protein
VLIAAAKQGELIEEEDQLLLVSEPEGAALTCRRNKLENNWRLDHAPCKVASMLSRSAFSDFVLWAAGLTCIVLDCGAGTVDTMIFEVSANELHS